MCCPSGWFLSRQTFNIITRVLRRENFTYITVVRYRQPLTAHLPIPQRSNGVLAKWLIPMAAYTQHNYSQV
jgi:hypothetical protein